MEVWLSYRPGDFLLFAPSTYWRLIERYNEAVFPLQLAALAAGIAILLLLRRPDRRSGRVIAAVLAAAWLWTGWAFHLERYATINWAAAYAGWAFVAQGLLLAWLGVARGRLTFDGGSGTAAGGGVGLFGLALLVQPFVTVARHGRWGAIETFGVMPDPTAVATLGLLLTVRGSVAAALVPIPALWCLLGGATLWTLEAPDALFLPLAAAACLGLAVGRALTSARPPPPAGCPRSARGARARPGRGEAARSP